MSAEQKKTPPELHKRIIWIQTLTLTWMGVEATVSLWAAWMAHSPALLAFGGDSAVELLSATLVFWRFYSPSRGHNAEQQAARIAGGLLFVLAAFVVLASYLTLQGHAEALPSPIGIVVLILAVVVMPWLANQKRELSAATSSAALRALIAREGWEAGIDEGAGGNRAPNRLQSIGFTRLNFQQNHLKLYRFAAFRTISYKISRLAPHIACGGPQALISIT